MNFLSVDVGTTGCKCQLFSDTGEILTYLFYEYDTLRLDGESYVNVAAVEATLREMLHSVGERFAIDSLAVSSLGESFVLLDEEDRILFHPMLYTDPRGEAEAEQIRQTVGEQRAFAVSGAIPHSMYSLSKLLYIKNTAPDVYARARKVMLIGDYLGYLLTGERVIDYALAARTGAFDVERKCFSDEMLAPFGIDRSLFSEPRCAGSKVGRLKPEWGVDATLVLGSHDQVCAALGAGALESGDAADGMGTVECLTAVFDRKPDDVRMGRLGYSCVPYAVDGKYCVYLLNYSCGSAVKWLRKKILHGYCGNAADFFSYMEERIGDGPSGILVLPYFSGASTPYQDLNAKGVFVNLTTQTEDCELYRALMEGTAMEMRLNAETVALFGISVRRLVATGGGANSAKWIGIKAEIQGVPIKVLRSSESGLCGCALLQAVAMGKAKDLYAARDIFVRYAAEYIPSGRNEYEEQYKKYKKLYHTVKELF